MLLSVEINIDKHLKYVIMEINKVVLIVKLSQDTHALDKSVKLQTVFLCVEMEFSQKQKNVITATIQVVLIVFKIEGINALKN